MSFNLLSEYYAGELGGLCNDTSHVIRSPNECTDAHQKLSYQSNLGMVVHNSGLGNGPVPSGCSVQKHNKRPHFEKSPTGLGVGRNDLEPICRRTANTGIY